MIKTILKLTSYINGTESVDLTNDYLRSPIHETILELGYELSEYFHQDGWGIVAAYEKKISIVRASIAMLELMDDPRIPLKGDPYDDGFGILMRVGKYWTPLGLVCSADCGVELILHVTALERAIKFHRESLKEEKP